MKKNQKQISPSEGVLSEAASGQLVGGFSTALTTSSTFLVDTTPPQSNNCKGMNCVGCHAGD